MGGERLKIVLSLTPPLLIIITLFFGGIFYGFLQSLGYQPAIGKYNLIFLHTIMLCFQKDMQSYFGRIISELMGECC